MNKHIPRLSLGAFFAIVGIYADNRTTGAEKSLIQMSTLTIIFFAFFVFEQHDNLKRSNLRDIALTIGVLHLALLYELRSNFPLSNTLALIPPLLIESLVVILLYTRLGQALDPEGPFGLTEAERRERTTQRRWW
jgi:hypothetical protein